MRNVLLIIVVSFISCCSIHGQVTHSIKVKAGDNIYQRLMREVYLYPSFLNGVVVFKNGKASRSQLNYNMLFADMLFVAPEGDTLAIADPDSINLVTILRDTFFYDKGYLQLIAQNTIAKLAIRQTVKVMDDQKNSEFERAASATAIASYNSISAGHQSFRLDTKRDLLLQKKVTFFIGDKRNNFLEANKKNLLKTFPDKQDQLESFMKNNNINFSKMEDLIKLFTFLKDIN